LKVRILPGPPALFTPAFRLAGAGFHAIVALLAVAFLEGAMRRAILLLLAIVLAVLGGTLSASAAKRVALVIGIDAYDNLPTLQKAVNDEKAVASALAGLGFDVIAGENLTRREMNAKLAELDQTIAPGDTVFFYFAGHGVALGAENYLLPRDLPKPQDGEENMVRDEGHAVDAIVRRVQGRGAAVSFFVLDACRDNPLAASGVRSIGGTRGLTRVDTPNGVFVLFSAGIGQTALDRLGEDDPDQNSVFTRKLVPLLKTPGLTQVSLAKRVQREVDTLSASVHHPQQPAYYDQIIGEIELSPAVEAAAAPTPSPQEVAVVAPPLPVAPPKNVEPAVLVVPKPEITPDRKPGETFTDCEGCPEMVVVPAGEFIMGKQPQEADLTTEVPHHQVRIAAPLAIGKYEVTKDQFDAFVNDSGYDAGSKCNAYHDEKPDEHTGHSFRNPGFKQGGGSPAACLNWDDAKAYAAWLSGRTGRNYRLLTEAEWEYAALAGSDSHWLSVHGDSNNFCQYENVYDYTALKAFREPGRGGCSDGFAYTSPVGSLAPNAFGIYDLQGNLEEWVEDCWHDDYQSAPSDGSAWTSGGNCKMRVVRGGSWLGGAGQTDRSREVSNFRSNIFGLRVASTLAP
jgi:formylglycine-generating enzyme required for sulfatase activity